MPELKENIARLGDVRTERLIVLILSSPRFDRNYTEAQSLAEWLIAEADRVGWRIDVHDA